MRRIKRTARFKKDFKREAKGLHRNTLDADFLAAISLLAADNPMPQKFRDHLLTGEWKDHRDCHIRPDLMLIDRVPDAETLQLVRLGSHSELSL
jgi:mRNA interferase YafQ